MESASTDGGLPQRPSVVSPSSLSSPSGSGAGPIICPGHSRPVPDIAFTDVTADGYFLISACLDGRAMIRYGESGDWMGSLIGHKGAVWSARLNADATVAATGSADFTAKVWSALNGDELHSFMHKHIVKATSFTSDSRSLLTGGTEKKVRVFDLSKPDAAAAILEGHNAPVLAVIGLSNPTAIVSGAQEKDPAALGYAHRRR